jgi:RNA polymerase sigma factor (sigma-70 family)
VETAPLSIEAIYTNHSAYLRSVLKSLYVPDEDADDVLHDIIASLHETLSNRRPDGAALKTWLYAAARNHAATYFRTAKARGRKAVAVSTLIEAAGVEGSSCPDAEEQLIAEEGRRVLETTLARMAPLRRSILEYRLSRELPWAVIVQMLGVSERTAMRRYEEARNELEAAYTRWASDPGRRGAMPFPLMLALVGGELSGRGASAGDGSAGDGVARLAGEQNPGGRKDAGEGERANMFARHADGGPPPWRSRSAERVAPHSRARRLVRRIWRSRVTFFLLGGLAVWLLQRAKAPVEPPPMLLVGRFGESARPADDAATGARPRADAPISAMAPPEASGIVSAPPLPSMSETVAQREALDRFLLAGARRAIARQKPDEALALLQRHAAEYPDSKRATQRNALLAQLSK